MVGNVVDIGVISDTHGLLRPGAIDALAATRGLYVSVAKQLTPIE